MGKMIKLMLVSTNNNNKYYNMKDTDDGCFLAEFGRVGAGSQRKVYPISKWDSVYKSKIKKGYKDITELCVEDSEGLKEFQDIDNLQVKQFIANLEAYSKKKVKAHYNVSASVVTSKQIAEAQAILDSILLAKTLDEINKKLIDLYQVIPRKMGNVNNHLITKFDTDHINRKIQNEQDLLDNMGSQVKQISLKKENLDNSVTLLEAMGLDVFETSNKEKAEIITKLGELGHMFHNAFRITNKKTQQKFDAFVDKCENKDTELFFHGSRNENWLSIIETGLVLRPTNAVISGKMFGYGTYFADKAKKSYGYTSGRGSYWAKGNSPEAIMALFDVHLGNRLEVNKFESWCSSLDLNKLKQKGEYDSVFAKAGASLMNNEYIVYHQDQSTIKFIIQLKG